MRSTSRWIWRTRASAPPVADVVHLFMTEDNEQLPEPIRCVRARFELADLTTVGAKVLQEGDSGAARGGVFAVDPRVQAVAFDVE